MRFPQGEPDPTRPPSPRASGLTRLRLDIAYDGRDFAGWARQRGLRTVQGELERVLGYLTGDAAELTCAGRTDAGVHARGQVAHVDLTAAVDIARLNRALPADIRVTAVGAAPPGFDARFSAIWRRYTYRVCDTVTGPPPLQRHRVLAWPRALDLDRMNAAAAGLLGEHDFAAFCKPRPLATSVRTLQALEWTWDDDGIALMDIRADAFCHSMVRALVGVLLPVGDGRRDVAWPASVLQRAERDPAVAVMPAHPLILEEVGYPADDELGARQTQTRALRGA